MKNKLKLTLLLITVSVSLGLGTSAVVKAPSKAPIKAPLAVKAPITLNYDYANALAIVANPSKYLNKRVRIKAKFDKFSTLGLDYKPAFRSSEKYITFLIKRDDVTNHTIPLSEMKIFLKRDEAEKYIDLSLGDDVEFSGVVFSDALGDAWIEVEKFIVLNYKPKDEKSIKK